MNQRQGEGSEASASNACSPVSLTRESREHALLLADKVHQDLVKIFDSMSMAANANSNWTYSNFVPRWEVSVLPDSIAAQPNDACDYSWSELRQFPKSMPGMANPARLEDCTMKITLRARVHPYGIAWNTGTAELAFRRTQPLPQSDAPNFAGRMKVFKVDEQLQGVKSSGDDASPTLAVLFFQLVMATCVQVGKGLPILTWKSSAIADGGKIKDPTPFYRSVGAVSIYKGDEMQIFPANALFHLHQCYIPATSKHTSPDDPLNSADHPLKSADHPLHPTQLDVLHSLGLDVHIWDDIASGQCPITHRRTVIDIVWLLTEQEHMLMKQCKHPPHPSANKTAGRMIIDIDLVDHIASVKQVGLAAFASVLHTDSLPLSRFKLTSVAMTQSR